MAPIVHSTSVKDVSMMTRVAPLWPMALRISVNIFRDLTSLQSCSTCIQASCFRTGAVPAVILQPHI